MFLNEEEYWAHATGEDFRPTSTTEAVRAWVGAVGAEHPEAPWILSDYDTWERNPHYTGAKCWRDTHPEAVDEEFTALHYECGDKCLHGFGEPVYGPVYRPFEAGKSEGSADEIPF